MLKFFDVSNEIMFIKSLLYNTWLPTCDTVDEGDYIIDGYFYVFETKLIRCTKTGYIGGKEIVTVSYGAGDTITETTEIVEPASYIIINNYIWGTRYQRYTDRFISTTSFYDRDTHNRLVKYLRCYRDVKGVNLLPYINLYTDDFLLNSKLMYVTNEDTGKTSMVLLDYYSSGFTQLRIPIRFNTTYTIAMECNSEVVVAPAFFSHDIRLVLKAKNKEDDIDLTNEINEYVFKNKDVNGNDKYDTIYKRLPTTSFTQPFTYRIDLSILPEEDRQHFYKYKNNLYLLIQFPEKNKSSIVVLEGDYSKTRTMYQEGSVTLYTDSMGVTSSKINPSSVVSSTNIVDAENLYRLKDVDLNKVCQSPLKLLLNSTSDRFVYSDRLIEYLLKNAIESDDDLDNNIEDIQRCIPNLYENEYTPGVWNNATRYKAYLTSIESEGTTGLDMNGFIDKDTEKLLRKYYNYQKYEGD